MTANNPVHLLRRTALAEGVSFLLLLFVAMPLRTYAGMPLAVTYIGWLHGALFITLCVLLLYVMIAARWSFKRAALVFVAALVPFGPFILDKWMRRWEAEFKPRRADEADL